MLTKNDFAATDWNTLRDTPHLVGLATLFAGSSGLGTVNESIAIAQGLIEGQSSQYPLIRDLTSRVEMEAAQGSVKALLGAERGKPAGERLRRLALERVGASLSLLSGRASAEETEAYRQWLYGLAEKVSQAAREGGFFGFGGTQVSEGEQAFLTELKEMLQMEQIPASGRQRRGNV